MVRDLPALALLGEVIDDAARKLFQQWSPVGENGLWEGDEVRWVDAEGEHIGREGEAEHAVAVTPGTVMRWQRDGDGAAEQAVAADGSPSLAPLGRATRR